MDAKTHNRGSTMVDIREDCVSCSIVNNSFANSYKYDIGIFQTAPLINVHGLLIAGNQFNPARRNPKRRVARHQPRLHLRRPVQTPLQRG